MSPAVGRACLLLSFLLLLWDPLVLSGLDLDPFTEMGRIYKKVNLLRCLCLVSILGSLVPSAGLQRAALGQRPPSQALGARHKH